MNMRVIGVGVFGGMLAALALALPLYLILPTTYVAEWAALPTALAPAGYALAGVFTLGTGYVAARWGWAETFSDCVRYGGLSGGLAGMLAWLFVGAAAAGLAGGAPILSRGILPAAESEGLPLLANSVIRIAWLTQLSFWVMALVGMLIGALGGAASSRECRPWGARPRRIYPSIWGALALTSLLVGALSLIVATSVYALMAEQVAKTAVQHQLRPSFPAGGVIDLPLAVNLLALIIAVLANWRWIASQRVQPSPGLQSSAQLAAYLTVGIPILALLFVVLTSRPLLLDPIMVLGSTALLAVTLGGAYYTRQATSTTMEAGELPRLVLRDYVDYLILVWLMLSVLTMVGSTATALSIVHGLIPFIGLLTGEPAPSDSLLSIAKTVQSLFGAHVGVSLIFVGVAVGMLPFFWLFVWIQRRMERAFQT